jgi:hypothetical protein
MTVSLVFIVLPSLSKLLINFAAVQGGDQGWSERPLSQDGELAV